ncbi:MAG: hypothetical protein ACLR6J_01400 [Parabacteroides merdae]
MERDHRSPPCLLCQRGTGYEPKVITGMRTKVIHLSIASDIRNPGRRKRLLVSENGIEIAGASQRRYFLWRADLCVRSIHASAEGNGRRLRPPAARYQHDSSAFPCIAAAMAPMRFPALLPGGFGQEVHRYSRFCLTVNSLHWHPTD